MNKFLPFVLLLLSTLGLQAQLRFTFVNPATNEIIIKNFGSTEVDIQQYRLCALFEYANLSSPTVTLIEGSYMMAPGETVTIIWSASSGFNNTASDLGLYMPMGAFSDPANMVDFMQYGNFGQGREGVAVIAGLWTAGDFLTGTGPWEYTSTDGTGNGVNSWGQFVIPGCTAVEACNYNAEATVDDGSCTFPGEPCDDANATTINDELNAECVCLGVTLGCTDMMACNYNAAAAFDDGSCLFPGDNCDDENVFTINDVYGADCVCAGEEVTGIEGCTAMEACNYNPDATIDNGNCIFPGEPCDDANAATINDVLGADCVCAGITGGCTEMMACNYDAAAAFDDGSCLFPGDNCDDENVFTNNDVYGTDCVCAGEEVTGIEGCTAMEACNYNPDATIDNGNCTFPGEPCDDANAATIDDVLGADCVCAGITGGCTEMMACNYNAAAAFDDGSCLFPGDNCNDGNDLTNNDVYGADCTCAGTLIVEGCTDTLACNYDELAVIDNGLCVFPGSACDDNNANTVNDSLALDCTCVGDLLGCNDATACNYNPLAGANDGSCIYPGAACDDGIATTINDGLGTDCICRGELISIVEIVVASPDHNTLEAAVIAAGLQSALDGPGQYTLFAPTDAAFAALPAGTLDNLLADPTGLLSDVLLYHTVNGVTMSNQLSNGMVITTTQGQDLMVTINSEGVFINNAKVIIADILAENGVIHVIDAVLVPVLNPNPATVVDIIVNSSNHTILESAVIAAGLVDELSGPGPFTVFAPTDAAFNALPAGLLNNLLADPTGALAQVLLYHVAAGQTYYNSLFNGQNITTLLNEDVTVTITGGSVFINNSRIILANLVASNGIVHVIDAVLTPVISVEETLLSNSTIYPNPAVNELYVSTPSINGGGSYSIYSMTGSLIEQGNLYSTTTRVNIDALSQGMYQLKLVYGNDCVTRSFIKQ